MMKARQATRGRKPMAYRCQSEGGKVSVRIYSRLGDVLRLKGISVTDLRSSIANRFGFAPDLRTLARWARPARVRRLDMELAWTVAAVLDVRLEEVFAMEEPDETADRVLDPEEGRRLHELYNVRRDRGLTEAEQSEMDALIATYSRRTYERGVRAIAARDGRPVIDVEAALAAERAAAITLYQEIEANPERHAALIQEALRRQRVRAAN